MNALILAAVLGVATNIVDSDSISIYVNDQLTLAATESKVVIKSNKVPIITLVDGIYYVEYVVPAKPIPKAIKLEVLTKDPGTTTNTAPKPSVIPPPVTP